MSKYLMLTSLTDEGRRTVKDDPDRLLELNQEVESMGVKILSQWALLGPYDFVNIVEAPRDEVVAAGNSPECPGHLPDYHLCRDGD